MLSGVLIQRFAQWTVFRLIAWNHSSTGPNQPKYQMAARAAIARTIVTRSALSLMRGIPWPGRPLQEGAERDATQPYATPRRQANTEASFTPRDIHQAGLVSAYTSWVFWYLFLDLIFGTASGAVSSY